MRTRAPALVLLRAVGGGLAALLIGLPCVSLTAMGQTGIGPVSQPAPIEVWNGDILDGESGAPSGGAPAIVVFCPRNGSASGKVIVGSSAPVQGLKATISDFRQAAPTGEAVSVMPAAAASVRYGVEWDGGIAGVRQGVKGADILLEAPLETFPTIGGKGLVPLWVTVSVPKDAKAGAYSGTLTVEAKASKPITVPVKVDVQDWALPDTQDYRVWAEVIQQPDTLAVEYGIPPWSEKHWEMIGRSLKLIAPTGSRVVYVPLICRTNYGNDETMVRWVKKPDGTYEYDYTIMEKYLNAVRDHMGRPKILAFNVWEVYLVPAAAAPLDAPFLKGKEGTPDWRYRKALVERAGKGPVVTAFDPSTKRTEQMVLPRYEDPKAKALWQPLWEGIRSRMKARGLEDVMMLAQVSDRGPTKEEVTFWNDLSGGLPWVSCSHHARWLSDTAVPKNQMPGDGTIAYAAVALDYQYVMNPLKDRHYGWKKPTLHAQYWRWGWFNASALPNIRHEAECNITGNQRGVGHIGGDFWPCFRNKDGKRTGSVTDRYPESHWHSLNVGSYLLAPGPNGPVGTARLEIFREGLQECEARIAIETALTDPVLKARLGDDLARKAQEVLDERQVAIWKGRGAQEDDLTQYGLMPAHRTYYNLAEVKWKQSGPAGLKWYLSSGWAQRAARLFSLAGEVAKTVSK